MQTFAMCRKCDTLLMWITVEPESAMRVMTEQSRELIDLRLANQKLRTDITALLEGLTTNENN